MAETLKAPFPYFGGKSRIASLLWEHLGRLDNYIEPFFGSGAALLLRPEPRGVETANDVDMYLANFWRATQSAPQAVVEHADGPVNEADLHSRHRWLVLSDDARAFRERMKTDPHHYDPKIAGWWCWGACCWIGGKWCTWSDGPASRPVLSQSGSQHGNGVHGRSKVRIDGDNPGSYAKGVHSLGAGCKPSLRGEAGAAGQGIHAGAHLSQSIPHLGDGPGRGVNASPRTGRPQLADAYDVGRGVHANGPLRTCAQRRAWLLDWFGRLRDRLRNVRVCCGDWKRVVSSESVTTRLGITGVFLDPPYSAVAGRAKHLYAQDSLTVAHEVREWCAHRGNDPLMRICLAGYANEGHEVLEGLGWRVEHWHAQGGYGNRSKRGKANAKKERLWFSPHCVYSRGLFDEKEAAA